MDWNVLPSVITFIVAGVGAYLGAYLKKKGENLATHEDLTKLVDQVRAVTKTTKEIEAKISSEVWDRQKRWEVNKEVIFEVMRAVGSMQSSLLAVYATYEATPGDSLYDTQKRLEVRVGHSRIFEDLARACGLAQIVCSGIVCSQLAQLQVTAALVVRMTSDGDAEGSWARMEEFSSRVFELQTAIRDDLEIGPRT